MTAIRRVGILTSGGDCAGLNAVLRAVVYRAIQGYGWEVIGIRQGTAGLLARPVAAEPLDLSLFTGTLLRTELEAAVSKIALRARHRRRFPGRGVRLPILDGLTLAADIDTVEEAQEVGRAWRRGSDLRSHGSQ